MVIIGQIQSINPNSAEGLFARGYLLRYAGMNDRSVAAMAAALERDPVNPTFKSAGYTFVIDGRYEEALAAFALAPPDVAGNWRGEIAFRKGELAQARNEWSASIVASAGSIAGLSSTCLLAALEEDYDRGLDAARKWEDAQLTDGEGWYYLAVMYGLNGNHDKCVELLDRAVERGYFAYSHMLKCRLLDPARTHPGLEAVLEKARLRHEQFKATYFPEDLPGR
jgi:tetratricopeptide (TPR) repeat protein